MAATPDTVRSHWSTLVEGLQESPLEFYQNVEAAVQRRAIPDVKLERIEYREGGAFSAFRQYLRVRRRREVFDICGAPFGNGTFFSYWAAEVKPEMPGFAAVMTVVGYLVVLYYFMSWFGFFQGPIVFLFLVPLGLYIVRSMGKPEADDIILMLPIIGPLYDRFFGPITYYRIDTSDMFQQSVRQAVMEAVDQATNAKGIRALTELERQPVMRGFFRK